MTPIAYSWDFTIDPAPEVENLPAGNYALTVTDGNNCTETESFALSEYPQTFFTAVTDSVKCFDEFSGAVNIQTADSSLVFQFNGASFAQVYEYPNLHAGTYSIVSQDIYGCMDSLDFTVSEPPQLVLGLPSDTTIQFGVSLPLNIGLQGFAPVTWNWSDTSYLSCLNCPNPIVQFPKETIRYVLTILDENGCASTDEMTITVQQITGIFIPNVMGGSGENAKLELGLSPSVKQVHLFRIYDRWGEMLHESQNSLPGDNSLTWDGRFRGKLVNPGVYFWQIEVEMVDGSILKKMGDLTVVR